jgi:hypothetical protein
MKIPKRWTNAQKKWAKVYQKESGFEPVLQGTSFRKTFDWNVKWFETHAEEVLAFVSEYPRDTERGKK